MTKRAVTSWADDVMHGIRIWRHKHDVTRTCKWPRDQGEVWRGMWGLIQVSYTSFLKQSTSEPIRRKFDEVKVKEGDHARTHSRVQQNRGGGGLHELLAKRSPRAQGNRTQLVNTKSHWTFGSKFVHNGKSNCDENYTILLPVRNDPFLQHLEIHYYNTGRDSYQKCFLTNQTLIPVFNGCCSFSIGLLVSITGEHHWWASLVIITGEHHWWASLVSITGEHHWWASLVSITGEHHWWASLVSITGEHHWRASPRLVWPLVQSVCN
jgi:hypothetical protein